jgi:hypothetical protein
MEAGGNPAPIRVIPKLTGGTATAGFFGNHEPQQREEPMPRKNHTLESGTHKFTRIVNLLADVVGQDLTSQGEFGELPPGHVVYCKIDIDLRFKKITLSQWFAMKGHRLYRLAA